MGHRFDAKRESGARTSRRPLTAVILSRRTRLGTTMPRLVAFAALALAAHLAGIGSIGAQTYPTRTVRFILPFAPASGTDIMARLFADRLAARWGKPVVIENRPGGDGLVSIGTFANASD